MSWQYKLASSVRASPRVIVTRPNARLLLRPTAGGAAGGFSAGSGTWDDLRYLRLYIDGALIFPPSHPSSSAVSAAISYDHIALLLSIFELLHRDRTFLAVKKAHLDLPCFDLDYNTLFTLPLIPHSLLLNRLFISLHLFN
jgi:hypothetical protein